MKEKRKTGILLCAFVIMVLFMFVGVCAVFAQSKTHTNSIGMEFVLISAGSFMMGSPSCPADDPFTEKNENDCVDKDELPRHKVSLSKAFYLGKYEVTQEEWHKIMGDNPSNFKSEKVGGNSRRHPVENVSWDDIQVFISKLNQKEGTQKYRLPTEAEWEYAARAGSTGEYSFGGNEGQLSQYAWYKANSGVKTNPVGQLKPNAWGLYDMHGNVWEWVRDWYGDDYYSSSPSTDPGGPSSGSDRVIRGGSWGSSAGVCRSASRYDDSPGSRSGSGFRLALSPGQ